MKKHVFFFATIAMGLTLFSCTQKPETATVSGLYPSKFEHLNDKGETNKLYVIKNANGMEVTVMNIGARIVSIAVPDKNGAMHNIVAGYDTITPYLQLGNYHGAVIGRYGNRIAGGVIEIERVKYRLRQNDGEHTLNGGPRGFSSGFFEIEQPAESQLVCRYYSADDEQGFPSDVDLTVTYTLSDDNTLIFDYSASTSRRATYINIFNRLNLNLAGATASAVDGQEVYVDAANYVPLNAELIPSGAIAKVPANLNFTTPHALDAQTYNVCYVLNQPRTIERQAAALTNPENGISVEIYTTEPSIQLTKDPTIGAAISLDAQHFPDSPHHPEYPTTVLQKDSVFSSQTIYKFKLQN